MERLKGFGNPGLGIWGAHVLMTLTVLFVVSGCNRPSRKAEADRLVLEQKLDANARRMALLASHYQKSQMRLSENLMVVRRENEVVLAEAIAARYEQRRMREETLAYDEKWHAGMVRIEERQRSLQGSVDEVGGQAQQIDQGVHLIGDAQAANQKELTDRLRLMTENQQEIYSKSLDNLTTSEGVAIEIAEVQEGQKQAQRSREQLNQSLMGKIGTVAEGQEKLLSAVNRNHASAQQVAEGVRSLQRGQADIHTRVEGQGKTLREDISRVVEAQDRTIEAMDSDHKMLSSKIDGLATGQAQDQLSLDTLDDRTASIERQTTSIGGQQASLYELVRRHQEDLNASNGQNAEHQAQLRGSFNDMMGEMHALSQATDTLQAAVLSHDVKVAEAVNEAKLTQSATRAEVAGVLRHQQTLQQALDGVEKRQDEMLTQGQTLLALQETSREGQAEAHAGIALRQQTLAETLATMKEAFATLSRTANDIVTQQGDLHRMILTKSAVISEVATAIQSDQQQAVAALDDLKERSHQQARDAAVWQGDQARGNNRVLQQLDQVQKNQSQLRTHLEERDTSLSSALDGLSGQQDEWQTLANTWSRKALGLEAKIGHLEDAMDQLLSNLDARVGDLASALDSHRQERPQVMDHISAELKVLAKTFEYIKGTQAILTREIEKVRADAQDHRQEILNAVGELKKTSDDDASTLEAKVAQE